MNFFIKHQTPSGHQTIYGDIRLIHINKILNNMEPYAIKMACQTGCVNYGKKWSCPPFSININNIIKAYDQAVLIKLHINLTDMDYIKNSYQKVKAANVILKSICEKLARLIEQKSGGFALLSGSCNICKPCNKKLNLPCKKPNQMRFSMESTGINVEGLLLEAMDFKLQWYKKNTPPTYTSVASCVLFCSDQISSSQLNSVLMEYLNQK